MNSTTMIILLVLFTFGLAYILDRKNLSSPSKKKTKSNTRIQSEPSEKPIAESKNSKYKELITNLSIIDEILDDKLNLGKVGVFLDFGYFDQQIRIMDIVTSGKLAIFGPSFSEEIMEIVNDAEFNLLKVENASKYVKNEIIKLKMLL